MVSFKVCVSLLIFCLVDLSIGVSGVLKSPTIILLLLISPFILVSISLQIAVLLYWVHIHMYNCYIFLGWSFDHYVVSFFVFFHSLYFKISFFLILVLLLLLSFGLHLHEVCFSSPSISVCVCTLFWVASLIDSIYRGLVFVSIQPVFVFWLGHSAHLHLR